MGLDVFLQYSSDWRDSFWRMNQIRKFESELYSSAINNIPDNDYDEYIKTAHIEFKKRTGIDYIEDDGFYTLCSNVTDIEEISKKHPEHLFKIGYWRSSYNSAGINHFLEKVGCQTLWEIAGQKKHVTYQFKVDWNLLKSNSQCAIERLNNLKNLECWLEEIPKFDTTKTFLNSLVSSSDALAKCAKDACCSISDDEKEIYPSGIMIYGVCGNYMITKPQSDFFDWYIQALEIVSETADYVLAQKDIENYHLYWSY